MPVNNIELRVGQVWRTRGGDTATIEYIRKFGNADWPVLIRIEPCTDPRNNDLLAFDRNGCFTYPNSAHRFDLVELIEDAAP